MTWNGKSAQIVLDTNKMSNMTKMSNIDKSLGFVRETEWQASLPDLALNDFWLWGVMLEEKLP